MKKKQNRQIKVVVVCVLSTIVAVSLGFGRAQSNQGVEVYCEPVVQREITQIVKARGSLDPQTKVDVSAHVVARIERLWVEEGSDVRRGEPFLELEKEGFLAVERRAEAELQIARAQISEAEIDLEDKLLELRRMEELYDSKIASQDEAEAARLAEASARIRLAKSKEQVRQAEADLDKARDELKKTTIFAPISGRVIALNAEEGEVVVSGTMHNSASVIATVADLSETVARVEVDETDVVHLRRGQLGQVIVDALPENPYSAKVMEIGSSGSAKADQPDVTFFNVEVLLEDADERLLPGMSARAEIHVAVRRDTLVLPIQSVVFREPLAGRTIGTGGEDEVKVVFVFEQGRVEQREVEIGLSDATHIEILQGVGEGDVVVTGPERVLRQLSQGDAVANAEWGEG